MENSAPEVKIVKPHEFSGFQWNSIVPFEISVSDQEDGKSEFAEIEKNIVLLEVTYLADASLRTNYLNKKSNSDRQMLRGMSRANCLTCHAAKTKLIGPSFKHIADRYSNEAKSIEKLANKIIIGSTGMWGDVPMPPHPDLDIELAKAMVSWILNSGAISDYSFYTGTEGAFKIREKTVVADQGIYILTASYADRGLEGMPNSSKEGIHTVVLLPKK
ncbi:MAG: hypothetical protein IPL46_02620 [Saprospiraceae bacterium]|nr:hypothetical protein [Saprospiraceae bacterium]